VIICPNCGQKEMSGAIYCSNCGLQLIDTTMANQKIQTAETRLDDEDHTSQTQDHPHVHLQSRVSLILMDSGQILPLADRVEFSLGRSAEGQSIAPDVDLSLYNAYTNGISRLHAVVKQLDDKIIIMDLDSSNGTFLNGSRLGPYVETSVTNGDVVTLGKLKIQVLVGYQR
jgi:hypothetical protein